MKVFDTEAGLYNFKHFPGFAQFILDNHYKDFIETQVHLLKKLKAPVMVYFSHLSLPQMVDMLSKSTKEWINYIINNNAKQQITDSLNKWVADQLDGIGKLQLTAEDITTISYTRSKALKKFIIAYTPDIQTAAALADEIDNFILGSITSATNTYIDILKDQLLKREDQLLEAQTISKLGSFEWNFRDQKSTNTPSVYEIFEMPEGTGFDTFMDKIHPMDRHRVEEALHNSYKTGTYECEYRYIGSAKPKNIWSKGVIEYDGENPFILRGTIQDVTDRKKIESDLLQKTIDLEKSNDSLQQFASIASHDLKEPLRKIAMFTDMVLTKDAGLLSQSSQEHLQRVKDSSRRMQQMIEDILSFSSLSKDHDIQPYSLEELLTEVKDVLEYAIAEKGATILSDKLPLVTVSPSGIRQVFQNLISNSLKFARPGIPSVIEFTHRFVPQSELKDERLKEAIEYVEITVTDNGIGFDEQYAEQIFGLFNRLHSKSVFEGSGLGLSIARKIIENHGGIINAEASLNNGAIFKMIIPYKL